MRPVLLVLLLFVATMPGQELADILPSGLRPDDGKRMWDVPPASGVHGLRRQEAVP